jgi:predicted nuclease of predicted toxin-antitoxin system
MAIKFYCDEHIHPAISTALKNRGADIITAQDVRQLGIADEIHLQFAASQKRAIVTQDADFLRLHKSGVPHAGILFAHHSKTLSEIIHSLIRVYQMKTEDEIKNHVEYL